MRKIVYLLVGIILFATILFVGCKLFDRNGDNGTMEPIGGSWKSISTGNKFTVVVKTDGTLWAWGENLYGQIGDGTDGSGTQATTPKQVGTSTDWAMAAAGDAHVLALKSDGSLWSWGWNTFGQLGNGTTTNTNSPAQVGSDTDWAFVAAGAWHSTALKSNGTLWTWGRNHTAQLGNGDTNLADTNTPGQVGNQSDWKVVSVSGNHNLALKTDDTLWAWGWNGAGQLGDNTKTDSTVPIQIGTDTWSFISAGGWSSAAIKSDGTLWAWGRNDYYQLGDGTDTDSSVPIQIGTDTDWSNISIARFFTMAVKTTGTIWGWGVSDNGRLGNNETNLTVETPTRTGSDTDWAYVCAGNDFTIGIKADGTVWSWGNNSAWGVITGQLGDASIQERLTPGQISGL